MFTVENLDRALQESFALSDTDRDGRHGALDAPFDELPLPTLLRPLLPHVVHRLWATQDWTSHTA